MDSRKIEKVWLGGSDVVVSNKERIAGGYQAVDEEDFGSDQERGRKSLQKTWKEFVSEIRAASELGFLKLGIRTRSLDEVGREGAKNRRGYQGADWRRFWLRIRKVELVEEICKKD